uniref:PD-(D/E)XK nuclease superfamily protein n=1 Tax=viral metagenome TaxID=1070528 RepID=A0A6M3LLR5_9ZZZZ
MQTDQKLREKGPPITYDNTIMAQANECKRKLYWFLRGYDYQDTPAYFAFGRVWEVVLDTWSGGKVTYEEAIEAGRKEWESSGVQAGKNYDTFENLEALFKLYTETYPSEPFKIIGAEKGWEWPIPGTNWFLGGSLDTFIEWPGYGIMVKENKTLGIYLTDNYISQWTYSDQVAGYIWYLTQLKGAEVYGCLMDLAYKKILKGTGTTPQFYRSLETRSEQQLNEFIERSCEVIEDIHHAWDRWTWPKTKNPINCVGGIGKSSCLFRGVCLSEAHFTKIDPLMYQGIVAREGEWEPWTRK